MVNVILTGASRGIGEALARAVACRGPHRLWLVARDAARLDAVADAVRTLGAEAEVVAGDLGSVASARDLGERLRERLSSAEVKGATLIHNAGLWPTRRELGEDGLERAFVVNHLGPLAMQAPLLDDGLIARVMVVSAGLIAKGRFDPERTPTGEDFSRFRTYCTTKLCFAIAMRELAQAHPELDIVVLHPGVVRTDLGASEGLLGWLLERAKRRWEHPATCAERLADRLEQPRWSSAGRAPWLVEADERPWPEAATSEDAVAAVSACTERLLADGA